MDRKNRSLSLEALRIVAAFFVVFNHTSSNGFKLFTNYAVGSMHYWLYLFISVFCKFSVPVFFAISGALLLGKQESLKRLYSRRVLKFAIELLAISVLYYLVEIAMGRQQFSLRYFFTKFYSDDLADPLWYMYHYLAFLISLPMLRALAQKLEDRYFIYMIVLMVIFKAVRPAMEYLLFDNEIALNYYLQMKWLTVDIVIYPCVGYFLYNRCSIGACKKALPWVWSLNICGILCTACMIYIQMKRDGSFDRSEPFHNMLVILNCIAMFISSRCLFEKWNPSARARSVILYLSGCTMGTYLFHYLFMGKCIPAFDEIWAVVRGIPAVDPMILTFVVCLCVCVICCVLTSILKRIPVVRMLVE